MYKETKNKVPIQFGNIIFVIKISNTSEGLLQINCSETTEVSGHNGKVIFSRLSEQAFLAELYHFEGMALKRLINNLLRIPKSKDIRKKYKALW